MQVVLFYAAIVAGFAFPAFLIKAIRAKEENALPYTIYACLAFGLCILGVLFS